MSLVLYKRVFLTLTGVCGVLCAAFLLWGTEKLTGLTISPFLSSALLGILAVCCGALLWMSRRILSAPDGVSAPLPDASPLSDRKGTPKETEKSAVSAENAFAEPPRLSAAARTLCRLCAAGAVLSIVPTVLESVAQMNRQTYAVIDGLLTPVTSVSVPWGNLVFFVLLPLLCGVFFLLLSRSKPVSARLMLWMSFPGLLWLISLLLHNYLSYTAVRFALGQSLSLCTIGFALLFLLALARFVCTLPPFQRGDTALLSYGPCFGLIGFASSVGLVIANTFGRLPRGLSVWELCFFLPLSLLALCLVTQWQESPVSENHLPQSSSKNET